MDDHLNQLRHLLDEISRLEAGARDKSAPTPESVDSLVQQATTLGIAVRQPTTLANLHEAVDEAYEFAMLSGDASNDRPTAAPQILGNDAGVPGAGP